MNSTAAMSRATSLPGLAKSVAVRRLHSALLERGLHDHAAESIAYAVCDPTTVRQQLTAPGRLRVDGGYLEVVQTEVWTPAVMAFPTNPRALPAFAYEIEGETGRRNPLPALIGADDTDALELHVPGVRSADLLGALDAQVEYLRRANDLREGVGELGIREPLLLVPLVIDLGWGDSDRVTAETMNDVDGLSTPAILGTVDGSSRITAAHFHLGINPTETLFEYLGNSREMRQKVLQTLKLTARADNLSKEELARCLSLVAPAAVIVGFVPDDPGTDTLLAAINSRLGALHVDPPKAWSASSRLDIQLDAVLESLVSAERLDPDEAIWLSGRMTVEEAKELNFRRHADVRAAYLLKVIGDYDSTSARALRALTARSRVTPKLRAEIAAEGAIRSYRSEVNDVQAAAARSLLTAIYLMEDVQKFSWDVKPYGLGKNAHKITADAWDELSILGGPGKTAVALLVHSAYWLARMRVVPRQTRGGQADRRDITTVLALMVRDKRGIRQLTQIIEDGPEGSAPAAGRRKGQDARHGPARRRCLDPQDLDV